MTQLQSPAARPDRLAGGPGGPRASQGRGPGPRPGHPGARLLLSRGQVAVAVLVAGCGVAVAVVRGTAGLGPPPLWWGEAAVAVLTMSYIAVLVFGFIGVLAASGLRSRRAVHPAVADHELPLYTILVPLRAGTPIEGVVSGLARLRYPADRLQILLLAHDGDEGTRTALGRLELDAPFDVVPLPPGPPPTPPQACQAALGQVRGEFCVVYHPGDRPEPGQLREVVAAFRALPAWVVGIQAELRSSNPDRSWLTQFSAAELAVNFSLFLRGLGFATPLASTSNHLRVEALRGLGAWDPHNVTPGLDLGVRIPRRGWDVRTIASVTEIEAEARFGPWLGQRSRWIRGCYQTWLVHMRSPYRLWRDLGTRRFAGLQLTLALPVLTTLVTPAFWALIVIYLVQGTGDSAAQFPVPVISLAVAAVALGNLLTVYALMTGCMEHGLLRAVRTMLLAPAYGALMSVAAYRALFELLHPRLRHRWEPEGHPEGEPAGHRLVSNGSVIPS
jgi:cellulose synthase/poly-beta-1,6-N-acetylglucosamine synthase-like glycosyltransferase